MGVRPRRQLRPSAQGPGAVRDQRYRPHPGRGGAENNIPPPLLVHDGNLARDNSTAVCNGSNYRTARAYSTVNASKNTILLRVVVLWVAGFRHGCLPRRHSKHLTRKGRSQYFFNPPVGARPPKPLIRITIEAHSTMVPRGRDNAALPPRRALDAKGQTEAGLAPRPSCSTPRAHSSRRIRGTCLRNSYQ